MQETQEKALLALMRRAGAVILEAASRLTTEQVANKEGSANYVTIYDVQVQRFLEAGIGEIFPGCTFLAEEEGEDQNAMGDGWTFVIDPIDGTANFIRNYHRSAISVGALHAGALVWGAIYQPYTQEMFHAGKGRGAYLNGKPISVSHRPLREGIVAIGTSPYYRETLGEQTMNLAKALLMQCDDLRRCGSAALDLCDVACGRADAFFELILSPWDFMAGSLIVQEAGGWITTVLGEVLPTDGRKSSVAAGGPVLREEFLGILENGGRYAI